MIDPLRLTSIVSHLLSSVSVSCHGALLVAVELGSDRLTSSNGGAPGTLPDTVPLLFIDILTLRSPPHPSTPFESTIELPSPSLPVTGYPVTTTQEAKQTLDFHG